MNIKHRDRNVDVVMALHKGDIFKYCDDYYVAGEFIAQENCRECYNLSLNRVFKMRFNPAVEYWRGDDAILTLCDKQED